MVGFSSGENVRLVLRLKETARVVWAWAAAAKNRNSSPQRRVSVSLRRAGGSTDRPLENSGCRVGGASARQDGGAGPRSRRVGFRPFVCRWGRCDKSPSPHAVL